MGPISRPKGFLTEDPGVRHEPFPKKRYFLDLSVELGRLIVGSEKERFRQEDAVRQGAARNNQLGRTAAGGNVIGCVVDRRGHL